nr:G protein-coupled receptor [Proales similis]
MSGNSSEEPTTDQLMVAISHIPLVIIVLGVVWNTIAFALFLSTKELREMSCTIYMMFISVLDTVSLFQFNLNRYLRPNFGIRILSATLASCRLLAFLQYFSLQASAALLTMMTIDRFMVVISKPGSRISRLPFGTVNSALAWSSAICLFYALLNSHILMFNGYFDPPREVNVTESFVDPVTNATLNRTQVELVYSSSTNCYRYSPDFSLLPLWDIVQMIIYSFVPCVVMAVFNILLIVFALPFDKKLDRKNKRQMRNFRKKRLISINIMAITFAFIFMTLPATILFGFFADKYGVILGNKYLGGIFDGLSFLFHASIFFVCFLINPKFRHAFLSLVLCKNCVGRRADYSASQSVSRPSDPDK